MTVAGPALAAIGIGSNLDDPESRVRAAFDALSQLPDSVEAGRSRLYRTAPWGRSDQPDFVNAAMLLRTRLAPRALLDALLGIERAAGRRRDGERWGPRVLDLDLLLHGNAEIDEPGLRIPHPHLAERAFVLLPLADIDGDLAIPGRGRVRDLLAGLDTAGCVPIE